MHAKEGLSHNVRAHSMVRGVALPFPVPPGSIDPWGNAVLAQGEMPEIIAEEALTLSNV